MAFSIGGHSFSLSAMLGGGDKKPAAQDPARTAPPALPPATGAGHGHAGRISGNGLAQSLRKKLGVAKAQPARPTPQSRMAEGLRAALQTATRKFCRDAEPIQHALAGWCGDESASLETTLNPFNKPRSGLAPGVDKNDGLRSGVTGMLEGLSKADCDAPAALKERAQLLKDAVLFKCADGKEVRLIAFATPGDAGTGGIDALQLSLPDRQRVATRLAAALHDMRGLGAAYAQPGAPLPALRFVADAVITVGPQHRAPAGDPGIDMEQLFAQARRHLTSDEFGKVTRGELDLMAMRGVISERAQANLPGGALRQAQAPQVQASAVPRRRPVPPPRPAPTAAAATPAPRRAPTADVDIDMEQLFAQARSHLTPEEFAKVGRGELDLMDMRNVISQRVQLNAPGGDFLPPYQAPILQAKAPVPPLRRPVPPPRPAAPAVAAAPPAPRRAPASDIDIDMEQLFAQARSYLTGEEFDKVARGELDLLEMRDVISQRVELNAAGGDFLPAYQR